MGGTQVVGAEVVKTNVAETVRVYLRFFASVADELQERDRVVEIGDGTTVRDVFRLLVREHPELDRLTDHVSFARNEEFVPGDETLTDGDQLAFIPPVSGGT